MTLRSATTVPDSTRPDRDGPTRKALVRHVAISGELGSGKSAVAAALAAALGAEVVSTGAIHRQIAASRGQSALQTNLAAEEDEAIDRAIDGELQRRAGLPDPTVFDSRMAWHFVPDAFKVHLVVDPGVGAARMASRVATAVETYADVDEAVAQAEERHASEQRRFLAKYAVDIDRLRNYDAVIDTTGADVDQVAARVEAEFRAAEDGAQGHVLVLSPRRLFPTHFPDELLHDTDPGTDRAVPVVGYSRPHFFVLSGHRAVAAALRSGTQLLSARLGAEGGELDDGGVSADARLGHVQRGRLHAWEDAFGFRFTSYPVADDRQGS